MPRNKHPEETRNKILDAAAKVFEEKGFEQTTILDIVENMEGLTRGAFYHHFKSKEEVLNALSDKIFYDKNPFQKVITRKDLNGLQKLRVAFKENFMSIDDEHHDLRLASIELLSSPQFFMQQIEFNKFAARMYLEPLINEGIRDGSIKVANAQLMSELMMVLFNVWMLPIVFDGDDAYFEAKAMYALNIIKQLGLDLFDEELEALGEHYLRTIAEHLY